MKRVFYLMIAASIMLSACKDDNDPAPTRSQLLISQTWRLTGGIIDGEEVPVEPCYSDDEITFHADGDLSWDLREILCPGHTQDTDGEWGLAKDDTELILRFGINDTKFRILELTSKLLQAEHKEYGVIYIFESID